VRWRQAGPQKGGVLAQEVVAHKSPSATHGGEGADPEGGVVLADEEGEDVAHQLRRHLLPAQHLHAHP
jgi:hypothetical protein